MANAMGDDDEDAPPTVDLYAALGASWTPSPIHHPFCLLLLASRAGHPARGARSRLVAPALARRLARGS